MGGRSSRVSGVLMSGPLAPFADAFAAELLARGYTSLATAGELRQVARLSCWLDAGGLSVGDLSGERVEEFLAWQRAGGRHRSQWSRPVLVCVLEALRGLGVLGPEPTTCSSTSRRRRTVFSRTASRSGSLPTASTLIYGSQDAVLTDPGMTTEQAQVLGDWVARKGRNLTDIFITHGHGDHCSPPASSRNASEPGSSRRQARSPRCTRTPPRGPCCGTRCTPGSRRRL